MCFLYSASSTSRLHVQEVNPMARTDYKHFVVSNRLNSSYRALSAEIISVNAHSAVFHRRKAKCGAQQGGSNAFHGLMGPVNMIGLHHSSLHPLNGNTRTVKYCLGILRLQLEEVSEFC